MSSSPWYNDDMSYSPWYNYDMSYSPWYNDDLSDTDNDEDDQTTHQVAPQHIVLHACVLKQTKGQGETEKYKVNVSHESWKRH